MFVLPWIYNYAVCMWVTVQYVLLSHCLSALCFMSCALCYVLINFFMFLFIFYVCFLVLYVLLSILCVLFSCNVLCVVSLDVYSCLFYICVQFYRPLPPDGNPVAVNNYHFIPYHIIKQGNKTGN